MNDRDNRLRPGLPPVPPRMVALPIDDLGYPVPFGVDRAASTPTTRVMSRHAWAVCHNERRCYTCGQSLGRHVTFLIGPMVAVNRVVSEPPSHLDCATWNVSTMSAREGVQCLWTTRGTGSAEHRRGYIVFRDTAQGDAKIEIAQPVTVSWWKGGEPASRNEVLDAIKEGMPALRKLCGAELLAEHQSEANRQLDERLEAALKLVPKSESSIITLS